MQKIKKYKNKKIKNFFFLKKNKKKIIFLCMRKKHSNLFLTLTDCNGKTIICLTAAKTIGKLERRRRRKSPQTIEYMVLYLKRYFYLYNIKFIRLILYMRPGQYINYLIRCLQQRKLKILSIFNYRKLPYSKTRGRRKKY
jgi:ribosomal protein S11